MRVLIFGGSGLLGGELALQALASGSHVTGTYLTKTADVPGVEWRRVDLRDRDQANEVVRSVNPDVIINSAYRQDDWASTADSAAHAAFAAAEADARLVFVSSDAVFSGRDSPYPETARPDPITPYGAAKAAAETAVRVTAPGALIARTSLIISSNGASVHERRVHAYASGAEDGVLFSDDIRCPIHVSDLAAALLELSNTGRSGVHHLAGTDAISRYELGRLIALRDGLDPDRIRSGLRGDRPDPGPLDVRLDCSATRQRVGTEIRGARTFLSEK